MKPGNALESAQRDILDALRAGGIVAIASASRRYPRYVRFVEARRALEMARVQILDEAETARRCGWVWYAPNSD